MELTLHDLIEDVRIINKHLAACASFYDMDAEDGPPCTEEERVRLSHYLEDCPKERGAFGFHLIDKRDALQERIEELSRGIEA